LNKSLDNKIASLLKKFCQKGGEMMDISTKKVRERDGRIVDFDQEKITEAIWKAAQAVGGKDRSIAKKLSDKVVMQLEKSFKNKFPSVEDVQDIVEKILIEEGHAKTAKAYILYREKHKQMRDVKQLLLDSQEIVRDYIAKEDWRVYENANISYNLSGLLWHAAGTVMAYYGLNYLYPKEISNAHINGDLHLHNLSMSLAGYCAGWSLRQLLHEGFNGVPGKIECSPPKHLRSAIGQMINFIGTLQNEWAGAQAFSSFDTYLAPFVRADKLSYKETKQAIQEFVYNMNIASRWGGQSPFTNITLDITPAEDLRKQAVTIAGKLQNSTYADYQDEMDMINKALIEVLTEGDSKGRVFTFPIPTYNITKNFDWNSEISELLFEMTAKYGLPYFQNFIGSDLKPSDVRAMCCHLRLDLAELRKNTTGGLFGSGESTGSIGVVTINLPRIGYLSKNEEQFFEMLDRYMYLARHSLEIKRKMIQGNIDRWLLPYTKRYLGSVNNHFSTIGIVGMNEACSNFLNQDISTAEGQKFAIKVLRFMRDKLTEYQQETGHIYNLEASPAEGTSYRLAKKDKQFYPNIITQGEKEPYYTNSTILPVSYTDDLFFALKHQEPLQTLYTGGTVFHTFLGERIQGKQAKMLVKKMSENFKLPYYTLTPTFSICSEHGYLNNKQEKCPKCGRETEVYSRVVGYLRPVRDWNLGKQEEWKDRKTYAVEKAVKAK
jgi:ribonucleoside-triphosphate reductase